MPTTKKHVTASSDHRTTNRSNTVQALSCKSRAIGAQKSGCGAYCVGGEGEDDGDFGGSLVDQEHTSRMGDEWEELD